MKIIINKNRIIESVKLCSLISENFNSSPVFLGTLIEVSQDKIKFTSSNGLLSINSIINKSEDINIIETGKILVKTKTFFSIISKLSNEMITLEKVDNSVLKIKTTTFDSNINIMDDEKYPNINFSYENWDEIEILPIVFKKAISKLKHAVNNNREKVNIMSGICFISNQKNQTLEIIGTDSYKLAYYKFNNSDLKDFKFVIDPSLIEIFLELLNFDTKVKVYILNNNIIFKIKEIKISSKIIEGEYPNISKIISFPKEKKVFVSKKALAEAIDRGFVLSTTEKKPTVKLTFEKETIEVSFNSIDLGNSREKIPCKGNNEEKTEILLNSNFLFSLLKVFENDEICLEFQDGIKPLTLKDPKDPNFLQLLVPLRN